MVTTEISQLSGECQHWLTSLREKREEFSQFKKHLQHLVTSPVPKDDLPEVEHYDNQFEIQLSNISQLKHAIKEHDKLVNWEQSHHNSEITQGTQDAHKELSGRVEVILHHLDELKTEFSCFTKKTR